MPALTRKCQQIFMAAFGKFHPGEAIVQNATVKEAVDHLLHIRAEKAILICKTVVIDLLKRLEMVFNTLIILRLLWPSRPVDRGCFQWLSSRCEEGHL